MDDKLYRLTIPGAIFVFMFVGWLVADSSVGINDLLPKLDVDNTTKLAGAIFSGGFLVVVVGYVCGEIGLAMKLPDSNIFFARDETGRCGNSSDSLFHIITAFFWKYLARFPLGIMCIICFALLVFLQTVLPFNVDASARVLQWYAGLLDHVPFCDNYQIETFVCNSFSPVQRWTLSVSILALLWSGCASYAYLRIIRNFIKIQTQRDSQSHDNLWKNLNIPSLAAESSKSGYVYNLEVLTAFTHGQISQSEKLHSYISRAWGRVVIGCTSIIASVLALQAYWLLRVTMISVPESMYAPLGLFFLVNVLFNVILTRSVVVQQGHRVKLYRVLLSSPRFDSKDKAP